MTESLHRWQSRHRESAAAPPPPPSPSLLQAFPLFPRPYQRSRALDLACGAGQNAVWLAAHGWPTVAVDFAPAALERVQALAAAQGVESCPLRGTLAAPGSNKLDPTIKTLLHAWPGILLIKEDLATAAFPESAFDLILCFHYLDRAAFPRIERALAPNGYLLYETFTEAQRAFGEGPHSPDHLLRSGELRHAFPGLETLFYHEWSAGRALASLLARKPPPT